MRGRIFVFFLLLVALPTTGFGQSTLNFPRSFSPSVLAGTGFALVNPASTNAAVTFTMYGTNGTAVGTSSQNVPARGQFARLGSELFPAATTAGWVQVTSNVTGLQGFWLSGDFLTNEDGGEAASTALDQVLPLVTGQTEINLVNTDSAANTLTIRLRAADGSDLATPVNQQIAGRGVFQSQVSSLFPTANLAQAYTIRVTGTAAFAATSLIRGLLVSTESAVLNAVDSASTLTTLNFPHAIDGILGNNNYSSLVGVTNLSGSTQTVTIGFNPDGTDPPVSVQRTISAGGSVRETAKNLFSFSSGFKNGWIKVTGTGPLTGFVAYAETTSGGLAAVPVQATPQTSMLFAHIAGTPTWYTGLALLNTTTTDAIVEVYAITPAGGLIGNPASFILAAGKKTAKLLSEFVSLAASQNGGFVFVRTTNSVPLYAIELFGSITGPILSNVAASGIAAGITFTPPLPPPGPPTLTAVSPSPVVRGQTLILSGSNFSTTPAANVISFTGTAGPVEVPPTTATGTLMLVTVPQAAISGPISVRVSGQTTGSLILEIIASATSLAQNAVTVSPGQATSNADIYVAPPAGSSLNATGIGIYDIGAPVPTPVASAVEVVRGQTKMLVVGGSGITQGNGSTISFSGTGITIAGTPVFQTLGAITLMSVRISVDASAALGPRNVMVTNSNLDTAIVSGGIIIR